MASSSHQPPNERYEMQPVIQHQDYQTPPLWSAVQSQEAPPRGPPQVQPTGETPDWPLTDRSPPGQPLAQGSRRLPTRLPPPHHLQHPITQPLTRQPQQDRQPIGEAITTPNYSAPFTTPRNPGDNTRIPAESPAAAEERRFRQGQIDSERRHQELIQQTDRNHQELVQQTDHHHNDSQRNSRKNAYIGGAVGGAFLFGSQVIPKNDFSWKPSPAPSHNKRDGVAPYTNSGGQYVNQQTGAPLNTNNKIDPTYPDYMQHVTPDGVPPKPDPNALTLEEVECLGQPKEPEIIVTPTPSGKAPEYDGPIGRYAPRSQINKRFNENKGVPPSHATVTPAPTGPMQNGTTPRAPRTRAKRFRA